MTDDKTYLIFSLNQSLYGIEAVAVEEIFFLPELTPLVEAPDSVVGAVNLRGRILPVMELGFYLGQEAQDYCTTDSIIALKQGELLIGMIANHVHQVETIPDAAIERINLSTERAYSNNSRFIQGVAKINNDLIMLLDFEAVIQHLATVNVSNLLDRTTQLLSSELSTSAASNSRSASKRREFCPNATPEQKAIFRERAANLRIATVSEERTGLMPLAVIELNSEYFGIDLELVREFTNIRKVTPVPCCPPHIIGNINLRGEIMTLIDIREVLNLSIAQGQSPAQAVILHLHDLAVGVSINQVFDVLYLHPTAVMPVPAAAQSNQNPYLRGTTPYAGKMMSVLDMSKILVQGQLVVDETV